MEKSSKNINTHIFSTRILRELRNVNIMTLENNQINRKKNPHENKVYNLITQENNNQINMT